MAKATPREQPAVVLRSHFNHLRALLATATVALVALTAAVAIIATDDERDISGSSENPLCALTPKERHRVQALSSLSPAQPAAFGRGIVPAPPPGTPYDGDPGIFGRPPYTPYDGDPGIFGRPPYTPYDGDPGIFGPPPYTPYDGDPGIFGPPPSTPYDGDPGIFGPGTPHDGDWGCLPAPSQSAGFATEINDEARPQPPSRNRAAGPNSAAARHPRTATQRDSQRRALAHRARSHCDGPRRTLEAGDHPLEAELRKPGSRPRRSLQPAKGPRNGASASTPSCNAGSAPAAQRLLAAKLLGVPPFHLPLSE
jgi:hypothetical protein